jgi:drug/metabolite transporter (DMT)-like permease
VLILVAAVAHASWNYLAKTARGGVTFVWLCAVSAAVLLAPVAVVVALTGSGRLDTTAVAFMAASGALHGAYFVSLQRGYREGDLSFVYPVARGTGPVLATIAAIILLGERPSPLALAGGGLIVLAVLSMARGRASQPGDAALYAVLTGVFIAAYTLWDKRAVDSIGIAPIVYLSGDELSRTACLLPFVLARGEDIRATWRREGRTVLKVAVLGAIAYVLVLYALTLAAVSYVAPAREVSILIGAALGTQLLSEGDARRRLIAATAIVAGVVALAFG